MESRCCDIGQNSCVNLSQFTGEGAGEFGGIECPPSKLNGQHIFSKEALRKRYDASYWVALS